MNNWCEMAFPVDFVTPEERLALAYRQLVAAKNKKRDELDEAVRTIQEAGGRVIWPQLRS